MIKYFQRVFASGWRIGIYRLQRQFKIKIWNKRKRPWCWIVGHIPYKDSDWGYDAIRCSRCYKYLWYKKREYTVVKK